MSSVQEVVVLGGGVVGAAAAFEFARKGVRVSVIDAEHEGRATAAGAGIVSPGTSLATNLPNRLLSYQAAAYYPELLRQLQNAGNGDAGYEVVGALFVATSEEEAARLTVTAKLFEERRLAGAPNLGDVAVLERRQAQALFPPLGDVAAAIYIPDAARLNGRLLRQALLDGAAHFGAKVVRGRGVPVCAGGELKGVRCGDEALPADAVVVAGGAWTREMREAVGMDLPVAPQKGQIVHLEMGQETGAWPIVLGFHSHYMLAFPKGRVVVGATRETGSGFDTRVTAGGLHEVFGEALRVAPGLAAGAVAEVRVGLRPASPDGLPILGPIPGVDNMHVATGHGANGLTAGAFSGIAVARRVMGETVDIPWAAFAANRFA
ncbi:MAG: FAD-dependent oxidoreductase [Alicyclobacillus sp.]|nr:FAD-dependent oxidoreductase [Alicyclobacillus sp.]